MGNIREELQALVLEAQQLHKQERFTKIESVILIGELELRNAAVNLNMSAEDFAAFIGVTLNTYWKRAQAARVIAWFPEAFDLLKKGETQISHLAMIAPRITEANSAVLLANIARKKRREVEGLLSRITPDGHLLDKEPEVELRVRLTESQMELLNRAREILAHGGHVPSVANILSEALDTLLDKRDPMRKAERAATRQEKKAIIPAARQENNHQSSIPVQKIVQQRPAIPAVIRHTVWRRDGGQCTWIYEGGKRCPERMMLELDHLEMWCRGGEHSENNLTLRCRRHNQFAAERLLGRSLPRGREGMMHLAEGQPA